MKLYLGMSSFDNGMERILAHTIDPDIDKEREYLFKNSRKQAGLKNTAKLKHILIKSRAKILWATAFSQMVRLT